MSETRLNHHFKMHADVTVSFEGQPRIADKALLGGLSTQIEPVLGTVIQTGVSSNARMKLVQIFQVPTPNPFIPPSSSSVAIRFDLAASIPLVPLADAAGDIDMTGVLVIDPVARTASFNGFLDQFPAFEAFVIADRGSPRSLFQVFPQRGNTPLNLPGAANNPIKISTTF